MFLFDVSPILYTNIINIPVMEDKRIDTSLKDATIIANKGNEFKSYANLISSRRHECNENGHQLGGIREERP